MTIEYALPSQEYTTLNWHSHEAYENPGEQLKYIHRDHLVKGSFGPMTRLISVLAFGKETVKAVSRPTVLVWDSDSQGVRIKDIHL